MLQTPVMHFDNAYLFQQVVVFLMWMGLMKIAVGELKAILKEERESHTFPLHLPADEPGRGCPRGNLGAGWAGHLPSQDRTRAS